MIVTLNSRSDFVNNFLSPLNRVGQSCILRFSDKGITTLLSAADNTVVLYGIYNKAFPEGTNLTVNIPDLQRLIRVLQCIDKDTVELEITDSQLKYTSSDLRFTYHLLEDGILSIPPLSVDKIKKIQYTTSFDVPYTSIASLLKSSTFTVDLNKLYIFTKDNHVYAEINDKQAHSVDSICIKLCDSYTGDTLEEPLPVSFETFRTLSGLKCDKMSVKVNSELNVMMFGINIDNIKITYIVSGLIK